MPGETGRYRTQDPVTGTRNTGPVSGNPDVILAVRPVLATASGECPELLWRNPPEPRSGLCGEATGDVRKRLDKTVGMLISVDASRKTTLTDQVVGGIQDLIEQRDLLPGARLPSIRRFAADHGISVFTVIQAYDRLAAAGYVEPRQGDGFFVNNRTNVDTDQPQDPEDPPDETAGNMWLVQHQNQEFRFRHRPGSEWLPSHWLQDSGLDRAMRSVSHWGTGCFLGGYGDPRGFLPLREDVGRRLANFGIDAPMDQILLTNGITGAIDLAVRHFLKPGDTVLVDNPGYHHNLSHLRTTGVEIHGIPWTSMGPDLAQLAKVAAKLHPRLYVTSPIVHNPTGFSISRGNAFRLLQLADRYQFHIIEDDVDGVCNPSPPPRLASLDQLNRVIYVNGFSRSLSPRIRVGILAAHRDLVRELTNLKALTQGASSEFSEQLVHKVLSTGQYRKYRSMLLERLQRTRDEAVRRLEDIGLGPVADNAHGLFAWMDIPGLANTLPLAAAAAKQGMLLAPGSLFSPEPVPSTKMRFNVAFCQEDDVLQKLEALIRSQEPETGHIAVN